MKDTFIHIRYQRGNDSSNIVDSDEVIKFSDKDLIKSFIDEWLNNSNGTGYLIIGNPIDLEDDGI